MDAYIVPKYSSSIYPSNNFQFINFTQVIKVTNNTYNLSPRRGFVSERFGKYYPQYTYDDYVQDDENYGEINLPTRDELYKNSMPNYTYATLYVIDTE